MPIRSIRIAAELPEGERTGIEVLRTDTPTWSAYVDARRNLQANKVTLTEPSADDVQRATGPRYGVVNPGAGWPNKQWRSTLPIQVALRCAAPVHPVTWTGPGKPLPCSGRCAPISIGSRPASSSRTEGCC